MYLTYHEKKKKNDTGDLHYFYLHISYFVTCFILYQILINFLKKMLFVLSNNC